MKGKTEIKKSLCKQTQLIAEGRATERFLILI